MKFMENTMKRRMVRKNKNNWVKTIFKIAAVGIVSAILINQAIYLVDHDEKFCSTSRYQLMLKLQDGDELALKHYKENYIEDHIYLYNGIITMRLMSEQFNVNFDLLKEAYAASDAQSLQEFYDDYIKGSEDTIALIVSLTNSNYTAN